MAHQILHSTLWALVRAQHGVIARRQLVSERGEGNDQVDGAPDGLAHGALGRPGICGGGEHVFAKLVRPPDGP